MIQAIMAILVMVQNVLAGIRSQLDVVISSRATQGSVDSLQGSVDSLQGSVNSVQGSVNSVQGSVNSVQGSVDSVQSFTPRVMHGRAQGAMSNVREFYINISPISSMDKALLFVTCYSDSGSIIQMSRRLKSISQFQVTCVASGQHNVYIDWEVFYWL